MSITVRCPSCHNRYHVQDALRGKSMRCPNPMCRQVFAVQSDGDAAASGETPEAPPSEPSDGDGKPPEQSPLEANPPITRGTSYSGSISDFVPILEAEAAGEIPEAPLSPEPESPGGMFEGIVPILPAEPLESVPVLPAQEPAGWQRPPPVRTRGADSKPAAEPVGQRAPKKPPPAAPRTEDGVAAPPAMVSSPRPGASVLPPPTPSAGVVDRELTPGEWQAPPIRRGPGSTRDDQLGSRAPGFEHPALGESMAVARRRAPWLVAALILGTCAVIAVVGVVLISAGLQRETRLFEQALKAYKDNRFTTATDLFDQLVKAYPESSQAQVYQFHADLSDMRSHVYGIDLNPDEAWGKCKRFVDLRGSDRLFKEQLADVADTLQNLAERINGEAARKNDLRQHDLAKESLQLARALQPSPKNKELEDKLDQTRLAIARWQKLQEFKQRLELITKAAPGPEELIGLRQDAKQNDFDQDPEVKTLLAKLEQVVRGQIRFVAENKAADPTPDDLTEPSLRVAPLVAGTPSRAPGPVRVVVALVRGALYGMSQSDSEILWSTRVGIDTTRLPARLPATPTSPERFLVLSADRNTLAALDAVTGKPAWQHQLDAPCLGRPVIVRQRAYVPTYNGRVNEFEIVGGTLLGYFDLRQKLSVGGASQEGTELAYFPADSDFVYVLDLEKKTCVAMLRTEHPSGSLRSEPIIVSRSDPFNRPADLAGGPQDYLILTQTDGLEHMKLRVLGLPIIGSEAQALLVNEPRVRGWSWFEPYHDSEKLAFVSDAGVLSLFGINQIDNEDAPLFPELREGYELKGQAVGSGRAQVVHAEEQDLWVLANGELQRLHFNRFGVRDDQRLVKIWSKPLPGSPLHRAQVEGEEPQRKVFFLVTQSFTQPTCLATLMRAQDGEILWQRQIGFDSQGELLRRDQEVVAVDRAGALYGFARPNDPGQLAQPWRTAGRLLAPAVEAGTSSSLLLASVDGKSIYEIACPDTSSELVLRQYTGADRQPQSIHRHLIAPLHGTPALDDDVLILPLANGRLFRQPLDGSVGGAGPDWRAVRADEGARGHVARLGTNEFLVTDGSRTLKQLSWPSPNDWKTHNTVVLPARIIAPPVVLPGAGPRVCLADADGIVWLLEGPALSLTPKWKLNAKITAGPFSRGNHLGVVVQRNRLVWLDPSQSEPLWDYTPFGEEIVGQPQLVGGLVLVADLSGRVVGLDPHTGRPAGLVYTLKASAAPAAAPVAYGPDHAFLPLTDRTIVVLPLRLVRHPLLGFPAGL